jgi:L-lactate permease
MRHEMPRHQDYHPLCFRPLSRAVVAAATTNQVGSEAEVFKTIFSHGLLLACLVGLVVMIYAYVIQGIITMP